MNRVSWPTYLFLSLLAFLTLVPLMPILLASFKTEMEVIQAGGFALPAHPSVAAYVEAWTRGHFNVFFLNSVLVTVAVLVLSLSLSMSCAYALVTLKVPFRRFWMALLSLGIIVPEASVMIPLFFDLKAVGLVNTYPGLVLPQAAMGVAFGTFFLQPAFRSVPQDLAEEALIDGCSRFQILRHVIFPMVQPALAALAVFFLLWTWNDFLVPAILATKEELKTLPIGLLNYQNRFSAHVTWIAAGAIIVAVPVMVFYVIFQRQLIQGIADGALKE